MTFRAPPTSTEPSTPGAALALELRGLHREFATSSGRVHAVRGIDLAVRPGEVVAFLGPNGAGKTTTIDMILGLTSPTSGSVRVMGHTPAEAIAAGQVAAVMQTGGLLRDITVAETVALTASLFGTAGDPTPYLQRAGISDIADRKVAACSGGQQQRLRFAMALVSEPDLLLLDEPTTGMDVEGRREFWSAIREDAHRGRTIVFATHYLEEADAYADRVVLVSQGRIVADGSAADIKALASERTVSALIEDASQRTEVAAALLGINGVDSVDERGSRLVVHAADSDAVARWLLESTKACDLEIAAQNLEEAFVTLTSADTRATEGAQR